MKLYQNLLKTKGITQSMSRKATCLDNAVAENFFGLLKTELFYLEKFSSIDQLEKAIVEYIDYYNNRRIKLKLNGLSPVQYRIQTVRTGGFFTWIDGKETQKTTRPLGPLNLIFV